MSILKSEHSTVSGVTQDKYYVSASNLTAHVAFVATLLSPYPVPVNLELVCSKFHKAIIESGFDEIAPTFYAIDADRLFNRVKEILRSIPEYVAWNTPRNAKSDGSQRELFVVSCRYSDKPPPDDDFIDLDAFDLEYRSLLRRTERD